MTNLILFFAVTLGVTYVITTASLTAFLRIWLSARVRFLERLLYCPYCVSFWVGITAWLYIMRDPSGFWLGAFAGVGAAIATSYAPLGKNHASEVAVIDLIRDYRQKRAEK